MADATKAIAELEALGLPVPDTLAMRQAEQALAALGLPRPDSSSTPPKPAALPMAPAHTPGPDYSPEAIRARDLPIVDEGLGPLSWLPLARAGTAGYKGGEMLAAPVKNWLANRAIRGTVSGAASGAVEAASREANPVPFVAGGAASGAILGPAVEGAIGAAVRGIRGLRAPKPVPAPAVPAETVPGALRPIRGTIAEPTPTRATPIVDRDGALNMDADQLAAAAKAEVAHEKGAAAEVFGAERAKVYEANSRLANSATADRKAAAEAYRIVKEMEDALSDAQRNRLFGVGEGGFNADDLRTLARTASDYHPDALVSMSDDELASHLARAMTEGSVSGSNVAATRQAIVLRNTLMEAQRRGWTEQQIQAAIVARARSLRMDPAEIAGLAQRRMAELAQPAAQAPVTPTALPVGRPAPIPGTVEVRAGAPGVAAPHSEPLAPNAQQFPKLGTLREQVEADPAFVKRIQDLGGGRVQSNAETLGKAWQEGPMPVDEIVAWQAETPINTVQQTRALLTLDYFQQQRLTAINTGDLTAAAAANETISQILPGITNLRATGGRLTQAQAMFVQDEMTKALNELADMQAKGVPFEQVRTRANELVRQANASKAVGGAVKATRDWIRMIETGATVVKLQSAVTHINNFTSNAMTFATRIGTKPSEAAAYLAQGNPTAAKAAVSRIFGTTTGLRNGFQRVLFELLDDAAPAGPSAEAIRDRNIPLPRFLRPMDPFRQLAAADAFWKALLRDAHAGELAYRSALDEGLSGPALSRRVTDLLNDLPEDWARQADDYAKEFTFQADADMPLKRMQGLQEIPFVRLFLPFLKTPYNLQKFQLENSAAGILMPRNISGLAAGGDAQAQAFGRLTTGFALSAGALAVVSSTEATGDYPKDARERARWDAEGIKPYTITIGGKQVQYSRFAPLGMYIGQAVALRDALESGDDAGAAAIAPKMFFSTLKQLNDTPFLQGMSDLTAALNDPEKRGARFVTNLLTGATVPNFLPDIRNQMDPVQRRIENLGDAYSNKLPGRSAKLEPKIDVLGREMTLEPNRLARFSKSITTRRESPETRLMSRLEWSPSMPDANVKPQGASKTVKLKGADLTRFHREMGEATRQAIVPFTLDERFGRMEREAQIEYLDKAVQEARNKVRKRWRLELANRGRPNSAPLGAVAASQSTAAN